MPAQWRYTRRLRQPAEDSVHGPVFQWPTVVVDEHVVRGEPHGATLRQIPPESSHCGLMQRHQPGLLELGLADEQTVRRHEWRCEHEDITANTTGQTARPGLGVNTRPNLLFRRKRYPELRGSPKALWRARFSTASNPGAPTRTPARWGGLAVPRTPGSPSRGLCALGWPRVGKPGDRTRRASTQRCRR